MFLYKKIAIAVLAILVGVPTVSMAGSLTTSLIQGKTPSEAVSILAEQIDTLTGRVASLEDKQMEVELEIEKLKLENENLRLKTDEVLTGTAQTRANEVRKAQCAELAAQIGEKEKVVRAPFETQIEPLQNQLRELSTSIRASETDTDGFKSLSYQKPQADTETQILLDRLENGEELGDLTPEERDQVRTYQTQVTSAQIAAFKQLRTQGDELQAQIDSIILEMEDAVASLHSTADVKALKEQLNSLLCA